MTPAYATKYTEHIVRAARHVLGEFRPRDSGSDVRFRVAMTGLLALWVEDVAGRFGPGDERPLREAVFRALRVQLVSPRVSELEEE